jgi:hypothetical protein
MWVLVALLACVVAVAFYESQRTRPAAGANPAGRRDDRKSNALGEAPADVRLAALEAAPPEMVDANRNPFRFQPKAPVRPAPVLPQPAVQAGAGRADGQPGATAVPVQAPPPPIPLKFIGTIDAPGVGKLAALSDGKSVYRGREGDVIEGRYRIVKIGVESIVMEHLDGRGRQTIRLTG